MPSNLLKQTPKIEDGKTWFHTVPAIGRYPGGDVTHGGQTIKDSITVIDREGLDSMIASFRKLSPLDAEMGVLVDREHFSLDTSKNSDAMAWATDIREEEDGLWTRWEFTKPGQELYDGKILVSRSPVFGLKKVSDKEFRAVCIASIAMTNSPFFKMLSPFAAARAAGNQERTPNMKKVLMLLGLPETATEDEAAAALQALIDAKSTADTELEAVQKKCREDRAEAFISANKVRINDVAKFRENYLKDPDAVEATMKALATAAPATRIQARDAATPSRTVADEKPDAVLVARRNEVVTQYRAANPTANFSTAWSACRASHPDLFAE
jgi:hypothetical protein